jgi:hypothetical protein
VTCPPKVSDARRLKELEDENARLKKLLADQMLDNQALKLVLSKKLRRQTRLDVRVASDAEVMHGSCEFRKF